MTSQKIQVAAIHEAGHIVVCRNQGVTVVSAVVNTRRAITKYTTPKTDDVEIRIAVAGVVAEEIAGGQDAFTALKTMTDGQDVTETLKQNGVASAKARGDIIRAAIEEVRVIIMDNIDDLIAVSEVLIADGRI